MELVSYTHTKFSNAFICCLKVCSENISEKALLAFVGDGCWRQNVLIEVCSEIISEKAFILRVFCQFELK